MCAALKARELARRFGHGIIIRENGKKGRKIPRKRRLKMNAPLLFLKAPQMTIPGI